MDLNLTQHWEWLCEGAINSTMIVRPLIEDIILELSAIDWQAVKEEGIQFLEHGADVTMHGIEALQQELPKITEVAMSHVKDAFMDVSWTSRTTWAGIMTCMVLVWTISSKRTDKEKHVQNKRKDCNTFQHLCDLAKTSYIKGNASEVIRVVDELNVNLNYPGACSQMTLFMCACLGGNAWLVYQLLKRGADIGSRNSHGDTCLHLAVFATSGKGHPRKHLVEILLRNGASVNAQNNKGDTALHLAAMHGDKDMIQLLLLFGADTSITTSDGILAIHIATNAGFMAAAKLLLVKLDCGWTGDGLGTPPMVNIGLLSPEKAHLVMSSKPKKIPDLS